MKNITNLENMRASIVKGRESNPKKLKVPGSSPLHLYVEEILILRSEGFTLDEICRSLYLNHQVKISKPGLSMYLSRHHKRISKITPPNSSMSNASMSGASMSGTSLSNNAPLSNQTPSYSPPPSQPSYSAPNISAPNAHGSDVAVNGSIDIVRPVIASEKAGQGDSGNITSAPVTMSREERRLRAKIRDYIESASPIVQNNFPMKFGDGKRLEHFESDLSFWPEYFKLVGA
jgi:hypothetical protein